MSPGEKRPPRASVGMDISGTLETQKDDSDKIRGYFILWGCIWCFFILFEAAVYSVTVPRNLNSDSRC